jgi:acyl dehydratase
MAKQLYWEDVKVGAEVTPLPKVATTLMLVKWAGASGDFNPLHYDEQFAASAGTGKPVVHGALKRQWLIHLMTDWIGDEGTLKKFSCQYRAFDYPRLMKTGSEPHDGETWLCKGKVATKYIEGNERLVDCDIWLENGKGEITTPGKATVILPSREASPG